MSLASGRPARRAFMSQSARSKGEIACTAMPLRPIEAPAQSSLSKIFWMSFGSSPMRLGAISFAWAYMPGPPARLE